MLLNKPKAFFPLKKNAKKPEMPLHLKRIRAEMVATSPDAIIPVQILLNEVNETTLVLCGSDAVAPGKTVTLSLHEPFQAKIQAKVVWYQEARACPRILMDVNYLVRMGLEFAPVDEEQKKAIEKLCDEIRGYHIPFISYVD